MGLDVQDLVPNTEAPIKRKDARKFLKLMMWYECVLIEMETKLRVLDKEFSILHRRNPIHSIQTRIKRPTSIEEKLSRLGKDNSVENIANTLDDVAGIRVICSFNRDIYSLIDMLTKQDDIELITIKDYVKNPKPNGYRSVHLILALPIFLSDEKRIVRVEVQFRTIAMDFWASLEYEMRYKKKIQNADIIYDELKYCAESISAIDSKMQDILKLIESTYADEPDIEIDRANAILNKSK